MPDYRKTEGPAYAWRRAHGVQIHNPRNGPASIVFLEEDVVQVAGKEFQKPNVDSCAAQFNPARVIPLVDLVTNLPTGETVTAQYLYLILHSLYLDVAAERDGRPQ